MLASPAALDFELLGVPVHAVSDDPQLAQRIGACYGRSLDPGGPRPTAIHAELLRRVDGFEARIEGRDSIRIPGPIEALRTWNHELLHAVMRRASDLFYVHAAVVAFPSGALVLPGLSRAGKSTLALAFLEAGARFLSDELLAFDPQRRRALAFPRALKVRDECVAYFPRHRQAWIGSGEGRFLPFEFLPPDVVQEEAPVRAIVVPRWEHPSGSDAGPTLEPLTPGRVLLDVTASALNFGTHRSTSVEWLARLVEDARSLRLTWHEPHAAVRVVRQALEEA